MAVIIGLQLVPKIINKKMLQDRSVIGGNEEEIDWAIIEREMILALQLRIVW